MKHPSLSPRTALRHREERFGPNMTPMIDIVLVILIFFMAGATFLGQEWFIKSELLKKGRATSEQDPLHLPPIRLVLTLTRDSAGAVVVTGMGDAPLPLSSFAQRIREFTQGVETDKIVVFVQPAGEVSYNDVVRVHETCFAAGIERVAITAAP